MSTIPAPTPEDLTRDLAADWALCCEYRPEFCPWEPRSFGYRAVHGWPAALRLLAAAESARDKLQRLKTWVHEFLDGQGVPLDPDPEGTQRHGCRIGGRLRHVFTRIDALDKNLQAITEVCALAGIGSHGQSVLCRVKDLHAQLGQQIERADAAERERDQAEQVAAARAASDPAVRDLLLYEFGTTEEDLIREELGRRRQEYHRLRQQLHSEIEAFRQERDRLLAEIGEPPVGSPPDEARPRAATWHHERLNWLAEVDRLRGEVQRLEAARQWMSERADKLDRNWAAHHNACMKTVREALGLPESAGMAEITEAITALRAAGMVGGDQVHQQRKTS